MAKSKSGGTRAYIRGKIGADVYSIGRDGKGARQQVVRSLAEVVSNPQTENQMRGRMIMSTVMQAVSALSPIIDHSFDNVPNGQPSISEFIRANYALVKADVQDHPETNNSFGLNKYQEKGCKGGAYQVSFGKVLVTSALAFDKSKLTISFTLTMGSENSTFGDLKNLLGLNAGDYITFIGIEYETGKLLYGRAYIKDGVADSTAITSESIKTMFEFDTNDNVQVKFAENVVTFYGRGNVQSAGAILSKKVLGAWEHSTSFLDNVNSPEYIAKWALPTYPVGSQRFLNGGEL